MRDYQKQNLGTLSSKGETPLEMTEAKMPSAESLARQIWLNYYNNYLYEHHLITEEEKRKMQRKIERLGGGLGR